MCIICDMKDPLYKPLYGSNDLSLYNELNISCSNIIELPKLPVNIIKLTLEHCINLKNIISFPASLEVLICNNCNKLEVFPEFPETLEKLDCSDCIGLKSLPNLLYYLLILDCSGCIELINLPELPHSLNKLNCSHCINLVSLPELPENLEILNCYNCIKLSNIPELPDSLLILEVIVGYLNKESKKRYYDFMLRNKNLEKPDGLSIEDIIFGIEIETCFHILNTDLKEEESLKYLYNYFITKEGGIEWEFTGDEHSVKYDKWIIMEDSSINCSSKDKKINDRLCIISGSKAPMEKCDNMTFFPVEIVSPKLTIGKIPGRSSKGLEELYYVFYKYIYSKDIIYTVNKSQGLHINMSHPLMDKRKFLYWWVVYENIILKLLPLHRRKNIAEYSEPITGYKNEMLYQTLNYKFVSVRTHKDRFEVRIGEGSISFFDIYYWLMFCLIFLYRTIETSLEPHTEYLKAFDPTESKEYFEDKPKAFPTEEDGIRSLLDFIKDDGVQKMLLKRYNSYNDNKLEYITSGITILKPPWNTKILF